MQAGPHSFFKQRPGGSSILPLLLFFALTSAIAPAHAQIQTEEPEPPLTQLCRDLTSQKKPKTELFKLMGDTLRAATNPQFYARPEIYEADVGTPELSTTHEAEENLDADEIADAADPTAIASAENIVFSFSPLELRTQPEQLKKDIAEYYSLGKRIKKVRIYHTRLRRQKTFERCMAKAESDHYDPLEFRKLLVRQAQLIHAEFQIQAKPIYKSFKRVKRRLKLKWTYVQVTELDAVKAALQNPKVRNVVLLHHTLETGLLVDSNRNGYPKTFFDGLSPNLQSLSIFACHSGKMRALYDLQKNAKGGPTLFIAKESKFLNREGVAPMSVFRTFLLDVDKALIHRPISTTATKSAHPTNDCKIITRGITPTTGDYGVMVNGIYSGTLKSGQGSGDFSFPCSHLAGQAASSADVRLVVLSIFDRSNLKLTDAQIAVLTPQGSAQSTRVHDFKRDDESVSSVKSIF